MLFLILLCGSTALAGATMAVRRAFQPRAAARLGMSLAMVLAGLSHLVMPTPFVQHMPEWVPVREMLVAVTGVLEAGLGAALLLRSRARALAGLALGGYFVAVFPANLYVAVAGVEVDGQPGGWYPWFRLPFQALFIVWALWSTREASLSADDLPPTVTRIGYVAQRPDGRAAWKAVSRQSRVDS